MLIGRQVLNMLCTFVIFRHYKQDKLIKMYLYLIIVYNKDANNVRQKIIIIFCNITLSLTVT